MKRLLLLFVWVALLEQAVAQDALVAKRWHTSSTENFTVFSQLSRRQTQGQASDLEQWRSASLQLLENVSPQVQASIKTYLYLFSSEDDFALFSDGSEPAYFFSSPRANFIIVQDNESGVKLAKHHYAHFLLNNRPQGLPRWYEEGMSHYLSRLDTTGRDARLNRLSDEEFELMDALNSAIALEELFYDDSALASPRLVQIANLKSAFFMHYLRHAHEREGFSNRTDTLVDYLSFLDQGRSERFAFDQAFDASMSVLAQDFQRYLEAGLRQSERNIELFSLPSGNEVEAQQVSADDKALWLAELALHSGRFTLSAYLFNSLIEGSQAPGRAYSGYADAMRMGDLESESVTLLYEQAALRSPDDYQIHLDFGQFYDSKRNSCDPAPTAQERMFYESEMQRHFQRALALNPESTEVNLSYAQVFLFEQQRWQEGVEYQRKAFAGLPSDTFVQEQAIEYALRDSDFDYAQTLIERLARPMHFWGTPVWVDELRMKLNAAQRVEPHDICANAN